MRKCVGVRRCADVYDRVRLCAGVQMYVFSSLS